MVWNKNIKGRMLIGLATLGVLLVANGCNTDGTADKDFFPADETTQFKKIVNAQAAVGAQKDATLYADHFDGNALNSLGQAKLDLITANLPDSGPVMIYISAGPAPTTRPNDVATSRFDSVKQYLVASHLSDDQFQIVTGENPGNTFMAGYSLNNYAKTDTGTASNSTSSDSGSGTAGSANAAAH